MRRHIAASRKNIETKIARQLEIEAKIAQTIETESTPVQGEK